MLHDTFGSNEDPYDNNCGHMLIGYMLPAANSDASCPCPDAPVPVAVPAPISLVPASPSDEEAVVSPSTAFKLSSGPMVKNAIVAIIKFSRKLLVLCISNCSLTRYI